MFYIFLIANKSHEKTNHALTPLMIIVCVSKALYSLFLCDTELHCCPETIKWATFFLHWVTCFFIMPNTDTVV